MHSTPARLPRLAFFLAAATFGTFTARAATVNWDTSITAGFQAGSGTWGTDVFWTTDGTLLAAWTAGDIATFQGDTTPVTNTITLNTNQSIGGLIFGGATTSGTWTFAGTGGLVLSSNSTVLVNAGSTATIGNVISGANGLTKTGTGTLILTSAETYTGATTINGGILRLNGAGRIAAGTSIIVNAGGEFAMGRSDTWGSAATTTAATSPVITLNAGGVMSSNGNFNTIWNLNLNGGTLNANGGVNGSFPAFQLMGTVKVTENSLITGSGTNGTVNTAAIFDITGGKLLTVSAILRGSNGGSGEAAGTITKNGYGNMSLLAANTYIGGTTLNAGGILVGNNAALGTGSFTFAGSNARLSSDGATARTLANNIVLTNDAIIGDGVNNGVLQFNGTVTTTSDRYVTMMSDAIFAGAVGGAGNLRKLGLGNLTLAGTNTLSGILEVQSGKLTLDYSTNNTTKFAGALNLQGGNLELAGGSFAQAATSTNLNGGVLLSRASGTATLSLGAITRNAGGLLNVASAGLATTTTANVNGVLRGVLVNGELAANDGSGNVVAYTAFTDLARLGGVIGNVSTENVRITDTGNTTGNITVGTGVTTINTLTNSTATAATITIGTGNTLRLSAVGTVLAGVGLNFTGGSLTAGGADNVAGELLFVVGSGTSTVSSIITNNGSAGVTLTKSGAGTLVLSGANTYSGTTYVQQGILEVNNDSAISGYRVESGATLRLGVNVGGNYQPGITLLGAGVATSGLQIKSGVSYNIRGLTLDNAATTITNYGGTTSAVIFSFDINGIFMTVKQAASGSVVDSLVNFDMGQFGYRMDVKAGSNTATGDLHIKSLLVGGVAYGFAKEGDGTLKLTGNSSTSLTSQFQLKAGNLILAGGNNRLGAITFSLSAGTKVILGDAAGTSAQSIGSIGSVATSSIVGGNAAANSALTFSSATNQTYLGKLGGDLTNENNLNLVKTGLGVLTLSQANSFVGGTTLSAGGITLGNSRALGTGAVTLTAGTLNLGTFAIDNIVNMSGGILANGSLDVARFTGTAGTVDAVLTGTAGLAKTGTGTLALNGANTFSGNVTIAAGGTIQVGGAGVLGNFNSTDTITNLGSLVFNSTAAQTVAASISGAGTFLQSGTGSVTLSAASTYTGATTVSAGELILGNTAALGTSTVTVSGGTLNQSNNTITNNVILSGGTVVGGSLNTANLNTTAFGTFNSILTGTTGFTKSGAGILNFGGSNTYTGTTTISNGTLRVNGSIVTTTNVASGGTLGGVGTVLGQVTVASGGRIAPGSSVGVFSADSLAFTGGSFFDWELNNTANGAGSGYDQLLVLGTLDLSGLSASNRLTVRMISLLLPGNNVPGSAAIFNQSQSFSLEFMKYGTLNLGANANISSLFTYDSTQLLDQNGQAVAGSFSVIDSGTALNLVYTAPIPEPSTYGLGLSFLTLAAVAIRRRKVAKVSGG